MKIGFVISFLDFRNDVRRLIATSATHCDVVVFVKKEDTKSALHYLSDKVTYRTIDEAKTSLSNFIWKRVYFLFREIPKSRDNFLLMEYFKLSLTKSPFQMRKNYVLLLLLKWLPKCISYDYYLSQLQPAGRTTLEDIDQFTFFTAVADDHLLARVLKEKRPVKVYVYSWDHPYKHTCFSKKVNYLVGNDQARNVLAYLHHLRLDQIQVAGTSQFGYLHEFQHRSQTAPYYPRPYFYFGCGVGIQELAYQEVKLISAMATLLASSRPEMLLVVRPYPFLQDLRIFDNLRNRANVTFDDHYRNDDLSTSEQDIQEKLNKMLHATAFFHIGTTMGLEACLLDVPSFLIALEPAPSQHLSLYHFAHQAQNEEYLMRLAPTNTLTSLEEVLTVLKSSNLDKYRKLNEKIQEVFPINSFEAIASRVADSPVHLNSATDERQN
jgi:hypothetical protein